jgi:hypothetical protein
MKPDPMLLVWAGAAAVIGSVIIAIAISMIVRGV